MFLVDSVNLNELNPSASAIITNFHLQVYCLRKWFVHYVLGIRILDLGGVNVIPSFMIMSAADLKACYDKFDEEGLKGGVPTSDGNFLEGYIFHGNSEQIFRDFFGGNNPFAGMLRCVHTPLSYRLLN